MSALAYLSLQHVTSKQPVVYTNTDRMRAFRSIAPVEFANNHFPRSRATANPFQGGAASSTHKESK